MSFIVEYKTIHDCVISLLRILRRLVVRDEFVFFDTSDFLKTTNPSAVVVPFALKSFPSNAKLLSCYLLKE